MVAIKGHFDGKVIVPDEPLDLPRNQRLIVHVQPVSETKPGQEQSLLEWMAQNPVDDSALPSDLAHEHDHYLHGTPKKGE